MGVQTKTKTFRNVAEFSGSPSTYTLHNVEYPLHVPNLMYVTAVRTMSKDLMKKSILEPIGKNFRFIPTQMSKTY